jgi:large subunit ribosomal protein L17
MRHANTTKKLGRTAAHRKATLQALSAALLRHKRITTTLPKAKALRSFVEPLINRAKEDSTHNRRQAFRHLQDKEAVKALFGEVAGVLGDRPGGYTRVVKLGMRPGDAAEMAVIELVDFNDVKPEGAAGTKRKTRRSSGRRRAGAADGEARPAQPQPKAAAKKAAPQQADDFTRLWGIGPAIATALDASGIRTYADLAGADLDTLRAAVNQGTGTSDANVNEETWAAQARLAAAGDWDGLDALVERLKAEGATAHDASEADAAAATEDVPPPAEQKAEAAASDAANPEATGNPQVPLTPAAGEHGDAEQGAAPGTGEPPPEAGPETRGRSGHRG